MGGEGGGGEGLFLTVGLKEQGMEEATKIRREQIKQRPSQKMLWSLVEGGNHLVTTQQRETGNNYLDLTPLHPPNQKAEDKGAINGAHKASRMQSNGEQHREWILSIMLLHHCSQGDCSYLHGESQVTTTSVSIELEGERGKRMSRRNTRCLKTQDQKWQSLLLLPY